MKDSIRDLIVHPSCAPGDLVRLVLWNSKEGQCCGNAHHRFDLEHLPWNEISPARPPIYACTFGTLISITADRTNCTLLNGKGILVELDALYSVIYLGAHFHQQHTDSFRVVRADFQSRVNS